MSSTPVPYNFTLPAVAGLWLYAPDRDQEPANGWNSTFSESPNWPATNTTDTVGVGQNFFRTQNGEAQVSLTFDGTGIWLCFTDNGAEYALSIDGDQRSTGAVDATSSPACSNTGASSMLTASGLDFGSHNVQLRVAAAADREFRFYGGAIEGAVTSKSDARSITNQTIDDTDSGFSFQPPKGGGAWDTTGGGQGLFNLTSTFNCNYGSDNLTTFSFTNAGAVAVWGRAYRDTHDYSVTLQGGGMTDNLNSDLSTSGYDMRAALVYLKGNLNPSATYTVTYRNYNEDNPRCTGLAPGGVRFCCVALDSIQLFSVDGTSPTGGLTDAPGQTGGSDSGSGSKTNIGPILGGVFGGLAVLAAIGVLIFFLMRRRKREQPQEHWDAPSTNHAVGNGYTSHDTPGYGIAEPWRSPEATYAPTSTGAPASVVSPAQSSLAPPTTAPAMSSVRSEKLASLGGTGSVAAASTVGATTSSPPRSQVSGPSEDSSSAAGGQRLATEDLNQVLAFVAQRMDARQKLPPADDTLPPSYRD